MAHGLLIVRTNDNSGYSLIHHMYRKAQGRPIEEVVMAIDLDQLQSAAMQIGVYCVRAVTLFRDVYRVHNITPR
jgi:CMP-2-keto-3-deoxyoctulosonic acid synthetase